MTTGIKLTARALERAGWRVSDAVEPYPHQHGGPWMYWPDKEQGRVGKWVDRKPVPDYTLPESLHRAVGLVQHMTYHVEHAPGEPYSVTMFTPGKVENPDGSVEESYDFEWVGVSPSLAQALLEAFLAATEER